MTNSTRLFTVLLLLLIQSCTKNEISINSLIGKWKIVATSGGSSEGGYAPNFDYLIIDSELSFEVLINDDILAKGYIEELSNKENKFSINLVAEDIYTSDYIVIIEETEYYVELKGNNLQLTAPCCDRFINSFEKVN